MKQGLTKRGGQLLDLQRAHVKEHGIPSGGAFLSRKLGTTKQHVSFLHGQLVERGYMEQRPGSSLYWPVEGDSNED